MKVDLIIHNSQLVTCASNGKPKRLAEMQNVSLLEDGAVVVNDGKIVRTGKSDEILREFEAENAIDAGGKVVCPAFVDPHTHIVFAGNRLNEFELKIKGADYLEILQSGGGIISTVRQTREATVEELIEQSRARLDKMLAHGTCTAEVKTGYGLEDETELKMLRAIEKLDQSHDIDLVPTYLGAHAFPPEYKNNEDEYLRQISRTLAHVKYWFEGTHFWQRGTPLFCDVFCEKNAFSFEQAKSVFKSAQKTMGFKLKAHVDEFTNLGFARYAIEQKATSIDHLDAISDEEIKLLAASETIGVITPTVNFNFGSAHFADARRMIDRGCAMGLSTDYNPGSAPCPSQPMAMAIACRYQKLLPAEAFNAVTINAAFAVGLGESVGSLEAGKQADILLLDTKDFRELAYEFGGNGIKAIIKRGKICL
jgi:imidazolonepropionase